MLEYRGKWLVTTREAAEEVTRLRLDDKDILEMLEGGKEPKKRGGGKTERWLPRGNKIMNIVYAEHANRMVVIHVGEFTRTRKREATLRG